MATGMTVNAMAAIHAAAFANGVPPPWSADEIGGALFGTGAATAGTPGIGFAIVRVIAGEGELLTIAVDPGSQGKGHGRILLGRAEAEMRRLGAGRMLLEVATGNARARSLYAAAGWSEAGRRKGYYRHPDGRREDALILEKRPAPGDSPQPPPANG